MFLFPLLYSSAEIVRVPQVTVSGAVPIVKVADYATREARYAPAVVTDGSFLYIIGGMGRGLEVLKSVERFNLKTHKTEHFCDLQVGRFSHKAVLIGDKIFVVGGSSTGVAPATVVFADSADTGARTKALGYASDAAGPISTEFLDSVEIIDLKNKKVSFGPFLPEGRSSFACVRRGSRILILGGKIEWKRGIHQHRPGA